MHKVVVLFLAILVLGGAISAQTQHPINGTNPSTVPVTGEFIPATPEGMTQVALERHLVELTQAKDQAVANANALQGAIQECQHWLDVMKSGKKSDSSPTPPKQ